MTLMMYWVDPRVHILKVLCQYLYYWLRYRLNIPTHPKLTQVARVISAILDELDGPQGSYPESFMSISLLLTFLMYWVDPKDHILKVSCQYLHDWLRYRLNKGNRPIVTMPTQPKFNQVPRVIHDVLDVVGRPQGSYAESLVSISLLFAEI